MEDKQVQQIENTHTLCEKLTFIDLISVSEMDEIRHYMQVFASSHVESALRSASKKAQVAGGLDEGFYVDYNSILGAYPSSLIK